MFRNFKFEMVLLIEPAAVEITRCAFYGKRPVSTA